MSICPACDEEPCVQLARCRYPYTHHGPIVHGSKLLDYLISEAALREDRPDLFNDKEGQSGAKDQD